MTDTQLERARELVQTTGRASVSLIQRRLAIPYNTAQGLMDRLEMAGIVTPMQPCGYRHVIQRGDTT